MDVEFNFDGSLLGSASLDGTVKIWNVESGALVRTLEAGSDVNWLNWHPKGNVVLAGSADQSAWMWLATSGTVMQVFHGHADSVTCGGFTPDGKQVVTGSDDCTLRIWSPKMGSCVHSMLGHDFHKGGLTSIAFHHQLPLIMSAAQDGSVKLSNYETGKIVGSFVGHGSSVEAVAMSHTSNWIASGSTDGKLIVWDMQTQQKRIDAKVDGAITSLSWHPEQPLIYAASADGHARVWDARNGEVVHVYTGHSDMILSMKISRDGKWILTGSDDTSARLYES